MPVLLVLTQTHNHWGGIEAWMSDVLPFVEQSGWTVEYGLALGRRYNQPEQFLDHHRYIRAPHVMDGRAATPAARGQAVGKVLSRVRPDVVMPLAVGDALAAVNEQRHRGLATRILVPLHSLHAGTLADVAQHHSTIDMVAVVSGLLDRWARRNFDAHPPRVQWIRNGVPGPSVSQQPAPPSLLRIGYVGRLENQVKRACDVPSITAALAARGVRFSLSIAGDGPARAEMEATLEALSGSMQVQFHGHRSRSFLYQDVYPKLDCLLLTSSSEGSPLAVIEAMQHGVIPVVSQFFGIASEGLLHSERNCLTFPVGDIDAASRQLERLARDAGLRRRLSSQARASVHPRYHAGTMHKGWVDVLSDLINRPPLTPNHLPQREIFGRLDRWRMPSSLASSIRRFLPQHSPAAGGFDEWPGSVCTDAAAIKSVEGQLASLEANGTSS